MGSRIQRKPRILCLHGFRTSAEILKKMVLQWPETVIEKLDLVFLDAPFPAQGKAPIQDQGFDPPYYEWFQGNQDYSEYTNFEECLAYLEDYMINNGPFDGFLGFSQGAVLAAALPGMQRDGLALTKVPKIKFLILISGAKFGGSKLGHTKLTLTAFSSPLECTSLHFIGEMDIVKLESAILLDSFVDPFVINHPEGHTIPKLDEKSMDVMLGFIERIQEIIPTDEPQICLNAEAY
ncbi:Serine hydrolase FSH [Corchorus olitorius]|uniref:Serine hydrolase FSH n=1 Tax=Corchorus olitorius TaxID=93759 RepID=A0A1R3HRJ1_9ROSI|nr:Serine hydrolase FSH [Corchorus olitorius]